MNNSLLKYIQTHTISITEYLHESTEFPQWAGILRRNILYAWILVPIVFASLFNLISESPLSLFQIIKSCITATFIISVIQLTGWWIIINLLFPTDEIRERLWTNGKNLFTKICIGIVIVPCLCWSFPTPLYKSLTVEYYIPIGMIIMVFFAVLLTMIPRRIKKENNEKGSYKETEKNNHNIDYGDLTLTNEEFEKFLFAETVTGKTKIILYFENNLPVEKDCSLKTFLLANKQHKSIVACHQSTAINLLNVQNHISKYDKKITLAGKEINISLGGGAKNGMKIYGRDELIHLQKKLHGL